MKKIGRKILSDIFKRVKVVKEKILLAPISNIKSITSIIVHCLFRVCGIILTVTIK